MMRDIEPDLTSDMLPTLDAKYAGETAEEHADRMDRYEQAYAIFNNSLQQMSHYMYAYVQQTKGQAQSERRARESAQASSDLSSVEQMLGNFPASA